MKYYKQQHICKLLPVKEEINYWNEMSKKVLGKRLPICLTERSSLSQFTNFNGELNIAFPTKIGSDDYLAVVVESFKSVSPAIFSHEIMHWILKLEGYPGIRDLNNPQSLLVAHINDLSIHNLLWKRVKKFGKNVEEEINSRAITDLNLMINHQNIDELELALLVADDINNCPDYLATTLHKALKNGYHKSFEYYQIIDKALTSHNLEDPREVKEFLLEIVNNCKIMGKWDIPDETASLRMAINR